MAPSPTLAASRVVEKVQRLPIEPISQASAAQRAGRSGRTAPGVCIRLYSEQDFLMMEKSSLPDVLCRPLGLSTLILAELGIDIRDFPWISAPTGEAVATARTQLIHLDAIREENGSIKMTDFGRVTVKMQLEPIVSRLVFESLIDNRPDVGVTLAAIMGVASMVFWRGKNEEEKKVAKSSQTSFVSEDGDLVSLYSVFNNHSCLPYSNSIRAPCGIHPCLR